MHNESLNTEPLPAALREFTPPTRPETSNHADGTLVDKYGRRVTYIRLSITDRCDFRCTYCMAEDMSFLPREAVLSLEECLRLVQTFVSLGVTKVRITGGEPLMRRNVLWLLERIAALPGLHELVLTTNGSQLRRYAQPLFAAGVRRVNVSLDTLRPERFRAITRIGDLEQVLDGIAALNEAGFARTKLNTVMMRGTNDDEIIDLVDFAVKQRLDLAFIEEMPLGDVGHGRSRSYFGSDEALALLASRYTLLPSTESSGGPARYWRIAGQPDHHTRIGFISPHSHNFCDTCNRVRITAQGELYPCLGHNDATNLLPILRAADDDPQRLLAAIITSMGIKPKGHDFSQQMDAPQVIRFMSMTGG